MALVIFFVSWTLAMCVLISLVPAMSAALLSAALELVQVVVGQL